MQNKPIVEVNRKWEVLLMAIKDQDNNHRRYPPAKTVEGRENQLISLAVDLAEKQLLDGSASSQVINHYLKLGSTRERLEKEILEKQKELLVAKTESIQSAKKIEELYKNALDAMKNYGGRDD
jgi:hypothetical protein